MEQNFGVPQGSVLGPILFTLYVTPLADIAEHYDIMSRFYADDSQQHVAFTNPDLNMFEACIKCFSSWMSRNMLKLNQDRTELILIGYDFSGRYAYRFL